MALLAALLCSCGRPSLPGNYAAVLREITSVEFELGSLAPDPGGTRLAFVHATEMGRGLSILDAPSSRLSATCRAGAVVLLVGFCFDGGLFKLPTATVFWVLLGLGRGTDARCRIPDAGPEKPNDQ